MANARGRAPMSLVVVGALACLLGLASGARGSLSHSRTLLMDSALFSGRKIGERARARQQDTLFSGTGGALLQMDSQGQGGGKGVTAAAAGAGAVLRHPPRDPSPDSPAGRAPDLPVHQASPSAHSGARASMQAALAEQAAQKGMAVREAAHVEAQREAKSQRDPDGTLAAALAAGPSGGGAMLPGAAAAEEGDLPGASPARRRGPGLRGSAAARAAAAAAAGRLAARLRVAGVAGLRGAGAGPAPRPDPGATSAAWRDAAPPAWAAPEPHLFFLDQADGGQLLIWGPEDTLPRDVLRPRRPEAWLHVVLDAGDAAAPALLPHFLEHYSRLGVPVQRMLVTLRRDAGEGRAAAADLARQLDAWGVDSRLWLGPLDAEARLQLRLQVLRRVPIQDWVLLPGPSDFFDFGNLTAAQYLAQRDVEGINWVEGRIADRVAQDGVLAAVNAQRPMFAQFPFECDVVGGITGRPQRVVVAHKGYLRTDAADLTVLPATEAKAYFGPSADQAARCTRSDLYPLTPYDAYWKYYRTPLMTGNSYLWDRHKASAQVTVHRFRWHAGLAGNLAAALDRHRREQQGGETAPCGRAPPAEVGAPDSDWREAERLRPAVLDAGHVDVADARLACRLARNPLRFELPDAARAALRAARSDA
ncbi:hypothetical protein ACKKBG_A10040 [Auxenochlorella protothecoides x Auxenochlorella symbiontica]